MPTKRRRLTLSYNASSQSRSARLNRCWMSWMRSMRSRPMGGRRALPAFGIVRIDDFAQRRPRHDRSLVAETRLAAGLAVLLVSQMVSGHGKGLLFHRHVTLEPPRPWTLISIALSSRDRAACTSPGAGKNLLPLIGATEGNALRFLNLLITPLPESANPPGRPGRQGARALGARIRKASGSLVTTTGSCHPAAPTI